MDRKSNPVQQQGKNWSDTSSENGCDVGPPLSVAADSGLESITGAASLKHEVMVSYLYQQQVNQAWLGPGIGHTEGVLLRCNKGEYMSRPAEFADSTLTEGLSALNVQAAMTVHSHVVQAFLRNCPDATDVPLMNGRRVQVLPTIYDLAKARGHHFAAFIASEAILVVWDDDPLHVLDRAKQIESEIMQLLWSTEERKEAERKTDLRVIEDLKDNEGQIHTRPTIWINTFCVMIALGALVITLGLGFRQITIELATEIGHVSNPYPRIALVVFTPMWFFFGLFMANVVVNDIAQCFGPTRQMAMNSRNYSANRSPRLTSNLPHITIQCPVYKESLTSVIAPTIRSLKQAISTYELQGGTASIFVNDDGLQLISPELREARIDFYADHGIGWVARPPHEDKLDGFKRNGKFKKASNMNYGLHISCVVEDELIKIGRHDQWSVDDEMDAYNKCLQETLAEPCCNAWAAGNIRVGDYILIVDSDTRIPADCLLDAASEMEQSPEVAILQFSSGVMQITHTYFENGITFFTNLIYTAIRYACANGDVAPFVGHNAVLRWSAVQHVAFVEDDRVKFWSESHVSEDFDMALRLQCDGYIVRLAAWAGDGFKEGVSLTVYDELARWQKYAYGCNELLFHPIRFWLVRGPFTPLFRRFITSNMPLASKMTIVGYIGTYYAIGAAWIMTLVNYILIGDFKPLVDKYYLNSWEVYLSLLFVFSGLGNVALATLRHRIGERSWLSSLMENFKWAVMMSIFLGGLSLHISQALLCHMFEIDMTWGATSKEAESSNFFREVPKVLRRFWFSMTFSILGIAGLIIMARAPFIPYSWHIEEVEAVVPLASMLASHFLMPLALNPALMTFAW